jgi:hypothetical protein
MTTYTGENITEAVMRRPDGYAVDMPLTGSTIQGIIARTSSTTPTQTSYVRRRPEPIEQGRREQTMIESAISTVAGNYCGPYWSDGLIQPSVVGTAPALGTTDEACRIHDACIASDEDLLYCDELLLEQPGVNPIVGTAIGVQALARRLYRDMTNTNKSKRNPSQGKTANKKNALRRVTKKMQNMALRQDPSINMQSAPAATSMGLVNIANAPKISAIQRGVVVRHSEMIGSAYVGSGSPTAYNCQGLTINAGKFATFPWLAVMATSYDRYKFRKLSFSYVPLVPTSVSGRVGLGYDYDSSDATPTTRQDFFSLTRHSEGAVWAPCALQVPVDNQIRFTNTHTTVDSKLIDLGQLVVLTDATSATASSAIGDIICEYEVELLDPQQPSYSTTMYSASNPASGADFTVKGPASALFTYVDSTHITISLSPGRYYITYMAEDTSASSPVLTPTYSKCSQIGSALGLSNTNTICRYVLVACDGGSGVVTFTLTGAASFAVLEGIDFIASKVSGDLLSPVG